MSDGLLIGLDSGLDDPVAEGLGAGAELGAEPLEGADPGSGVAAGASVRQIARSRSSWGYFPGAAATAVML